VSFIRSSWPPGLRVRAKMRPGMISLSGPPGSTGAVMLMWNARGRTALSPSVAAAKALSPALHRLPVQGLRRKFRQFRADTVGIDDIGQAGLRTADVWLTDGGAPRLEHRRGRGHVLHVQAEVVDAGWPLGVRGLQLDERILADLDINQLQLSRRVLESERFR